LIRKLKNVENVKNGVTWRRTLELERAVVGNLGRRLHCQLLLLLSVSLSCCCCWYTYIPDFVPLRWTEYRIWIQCV